MKQLSSLKQQSGFTLIELVVVIVILGILAATALPKLQGLDADAKQAVLDAAVGTFKSAAAISYAKTKGTNTFASINTTAVLTVDNVTFSGTCPTPTATYSGGSPAMSFTLDSSICNN